MEWIVIVFIGAIVGALIGRAKNREMEGVLTGCLFGPLGWLIMAFASDHWPKCPHCKGRVVQGATKCKNCGSDLTTPC